MGGNAMGVCKKGKRKIIVDKKVYWWFVDNYNWSEPFARIIADDHSFEAECNLYCPVLRIAKDSDKGRRSISIPCELSDKYLSFTPQYISELIQIGIS